MNISISIKNNKNLITYIKPLKWSTKNDDIYAEPDGLRWKYYITRNGNKFELALIDDSCNYNKELFKFYNHVNKAKSVAEKHYLQVIKSLFIKETI